MNCEPIFLGIERRDNRNPGNQPDQRGRPESDEATFHPGYGDKHGIERETRCRHTERVEVPEGWVYQSVKPFLNEEGVVPMSVLHCPLGGRAETGGYKGYGLGLLVDILCGPLSGAHSGGKLSASKREVEANIGHFFGAMKVAGFRPRDDFDSDFELLVEEVKASPREPGVGEIFIPGEPEALAKQQNRNGKVPVLPQIWKKLQQIAVELNLPLPDSGAAV